MTIMFYASSEGVQSFTSANWNQVASKSGNLNTQSHLIWVSAEYGASTANREVGIRVLIDGNEVSFDYHTCSIVNQYRKFCDFGLYNAVEGNHTISLEVRALTSGVTVNVRRIRLCIMQE